LLERAEAASFIGTLQASYTDFPYINNQWRIRTEEDALLGVSLTGIADRTISNEWVRIAAQQVVDTNARYADLIGINRAARTNVVKPEGSSSCVLGTSSGMHSREGKFYIRRIQISNNDVLLKYLLTVVPNLIEPANGVPDTSVISIPQMAPTTALIKSNESAIDIFNRAIEYNLNWIKPGHRRGANMHNVSCTIDVADTEWALLKKSMWENRNLYAGVSMYPKNDSKYDQAPFEICTEEDYTKLLGQVRSIDLNNVPLDLDEVQRESIACGGGGGCEIVSL
jgi:ribonucleoside-diphosphate reductase alpha chain